MKVLFYYSTFHGETNRKKHFGLFIHKHIENIIDGKTKKETERNNDEVIEFREKEENEVKIENRHEVEAEAETLGDLKTENELVMSSEDETGVVIK